MEQQIKKFDINEILAKITSEKTFSDLLNKIVMVLEDANLGIEKIGKYDQRLLKLKNSTEILNDLKNSRRIIRDYNDMENVCYDPQYYEENKPKIAKLTELMRFCYAIRIAEDITNFFERKNENTTGLSDYAGLIKNMIAEYY